LNDRLPISACLKLISTPAREHICGGAVAAMRWVNMRQPEILSGTFAPQHYPPADFGPSSINIVGIFTQQAAEKNANGRWFEPISPEKITPPDLHAAQLTRRLRASAKPQ